MSEAPPDIVEAVGEKRWRDGTHHLQYQGKEIEVVSFSGRVELVSTTLKKEKAGNNHKVLVPMFTSPVVGFVAGFLFMGLLYVGLRSWRPATVNRLFQKAKFGVD